MQTLSSNPAVPLLWTVHGNTSLDLGTTGICTAGAGRPPCVEGHGMAFPAPYTFIYVFGGTLTPTAEVCRAVHKASSVWQTANHRVPFSC